MQLTKLDRWLKERFIYETHVFTLRIPEEGVPRGVVVRPMEENKRGDYRYRLIIRDNKLADYVINVLRKDQVMHATHVVESKNWYNRHIAPKGGGSFTYRWILRFFGFMTLCSCVWGIYLLTQNEALMDTIKASLDDFKSGL